jgi:sulfide:quinone oxidoreductase
MANDKPLPKAGVFAEEMGTVVAERIAAAFAGEGGSFLEVGNGEAMMVRGQFLAEPAPEVILTEPSRAYLEQKRSL